MSNGEFDDKEYGDEEEKEEDEEESIMDFASAFGETFEVEVDTEKIKDKEVEQFKSDTEFDMDLPEWDDSELQEYQSPHLKELISAGKGVCDGKVSDADLKKTIQKIAVELEKTVKEFEQIRKGEPDSITAREQVIRIERAFNLHRDAFKEMNLYFEDDNTKHIMDGLEMAQKATNRLYKSFLLLQESAIMASTKVCLQCGHRNPATLNLCEVCNAQLPKGAATPTSQIEVTVGAEQQVYYTNPNFDRLYKEGMELKEGKFPPDKFKKTIDWLSKNLETARKEYEQLDTSFFTEEEQKMFGDVFIYAKKAFDEYEIAFNELKKYFDDKDVKHIDEGLRIAFQATQIIAQVEAFSADVEKTLRELESKQKKQEEETEKK
ncbi:MAG TPA: hypothetical protein PL110_10230 [Candidatus Eremiobacteraeota bacterium]|nr:MAG: hypothetical protein BWY64_01648 [bacterium ADurb.Bin363]HPZ08480.1 hypothetical protein [Candidatus Eremiobacteraeota bacterium]